MLLVIGLVGCFVELVALLWLLGCGISWAVRRIRRRASRQPFLRRAYRSVVWSVCAAVAVVTVGLWYCFSGSDSRRPRNLAALTVGAQQPVSFDGRSWIAEQLAKRLGDRDTLVVLTASGGGSRAAYFTATMLEKLSRLPYP